MAKEKIGVYRRWLEPVPLVNGKPIPKSLWIKERRYSWTVRWFGTTGKRYSKNFKKKKLAERYARQLQTQVNQGKQDKPEKITLHDFNKEHRTVMTGQVAYATLYEQTRALRFFENFIGGSIALTSIKPKQAEAFIAYRLASGLAIATVNKDIRTLRRVFNLAIEPRGYLADGQNPFSKIKQRKKATKPIRYVSVKEYWSLQEAMDSIWWQALISVAYGSGLRKSEMLNLTWSDIDFDKNLIYIRVKKSTEQTIEWEPKDHENRIVPMSEQTAQLLADLQTTSIEGHAYIFILPKRFARIKQREKAGKWNSRSEILNNVSRDFDVIRRRSGIDKCTLHDLRRSAITNWAQHLPIQVVQQFAGHSDITTTRKYYLVVRSEDIVSARKMMNKILQA
ncbi:MAG: site-specific integrase [Deltaproteobacteria bacterium]|nr:site-specific integrase [Deltaproteobacteria bacterium]